MRLLWSWAANTHECACTAHVRMIDPGAPHCVNPSLIMCIYTWGGFIYALLVMNISMHIMLGNPWSFVIHTGMNYMYVKFTYLQGHLTV